MKHFRLTVNGTPYEIEILNDPRSNEVALTVDGKEFTVIAENLDLETTEIAVAPVVAPVVASTPKAATPAPAPQTSAGSTVSAPLPGVINDIKVREGQTVKQNDPLLVIEAMKAMNVIRAQRNGTVTKIHVSKGSRVAYGAALLDIE